MLFLDEPTPSVLSKCNVTIQIPPDNSRRKHVCNKVI